MGSSSFLVCINAVFIGVVENHNMKVALTGGKDATWHGSVDFAFVILFAVEIVVRLAYFRMDFFRGSSKFWNIFDLILTVSVALQEIKLIEQNFSFARSL